MNTYNVFPWEIKKALTEAGLNPKRLYIEDFKEPRHSGELYRETVIYRIVRTNLMDNNFPGFILDSDDVFNDSVFNFTEDVDSNKNDFMNMFIDDFDVLKCLFGDDVSVRWGVFAIND